MRRFLIFVLLGPLAGFLFFWSLVSLGLLIGFIAMKFSPLFAYSSHGVKDFLLLIGFILMFAPVAYILGLPAALAAWAVDVSGAGLSLGRRLAVTAVASAAASAVFGYAVVVTRDVWVGDALSKALNLDYFLGLANGLAMVGAVAALICSGLAHVTDRRRQRKIAAAPAVQSHTR